MKRYSLPQLRLGATSFLLHADYVPAVRFAAERCDDVALLLLETGENGAYLPTPEDIREIGRICNGEGASLHVHLPTDADFATEHSARILAAKARLAIERAAPLGAHSFVLHMDFPMARMPQAGFAQGFSEAQYVWARAALDAIIAALPAPELLAIENLENFSPNFWDTWVAAYGCSRCLDIGHIWKDGGDPAFVLQAWLPRIRVIHLHGLESVGQWVCDHKSLRCMPPARIDAIMHPLWRRGYEGVLTLEVFSEAEFAASHAILLQSWERYACSQSMPESDNV